MQFASCAINISRRMHMKQKQSRYSRCVKLVSYVSDAVPLASMPLMLGAPLPWSFSYVSGFGDVHPPSELTPQPVICRLVRVVPDVGREAAVAVAAW